MEVGHSVCVDGALSDFMDIGCGVPQGSVLGPLLYVLFTNDLPDVVHNNHDELSYKEPNLHCAPCGGPVNYVDGGTYTIAHKGPAVLSDILSEKYKAIEEYMISNKLVINGDKTHLVVRRSKKMDMDMPRQAVSLQAGPHTILPSKTEKLLGCNINQNLKWQTQIQTGKKSLTKNLTSRLKKSFSPCHIQDKAFSC